MSKTIKLRCNKNRKNDPFSSFNSGDRYVLFNILEDGTKIYMDQNNINHIENNNIGCSFITRALSNIVNNNAKFSGTSCKISRFAVCTNTVSKQHYNSIVSFVVRFE